jgi:hypothetical protein
MTIKSLGARGRTFAVTDVELPTNLLPQVAYKEAIEDLLEAQQLTKSQDCRLIEACAHYRGQLVAKVYYHPLVTALHTAYAEHRPVCLSPDMVWLLICQGIAHHINANDEALRSQFVQHQGKLTLGVRRDDFHKGSPENPWPEVFGEFSAQVKRYIGPKHDLFVASFSTTGPAEKAASEIVLLDAMQKYFRFCLSRVICGIPTITLEGVPDDWQSIVDRLEGFTPLGLEWWLTPLRPILRQFLAAAQGDVDHVFWRSIYRIFKPDEPCSEDSAIGWINVFFPYLTGAKGLPTRRNPWLSGERDLEELLAPPKESQQENRLSTRRGNERSPRSRHPGYVYKSAFPTGLARAPFVWEYRDKQDDVLRRWNMEFLGGFVGITQDPETLCLRPEIGWAVRDEVGASEGQASGAGEL